MVYRLAHKNSYISKKNHAPGFSCITLCRPMRWLKSLCKLCTVQLRPRPYLNVHGPKAKYWIVGIVSLIFDMTPKVAPLLLSEIQHFSNHNIRIMLGLHFPVRWGWRNIWFQNNSFPKVVFKWFFTNQCYFYLTSDCNTSIGGKYLRRMDQVGETVSNVSEKVGRRPLAVFFISDDEKILSYSDLVRTSGK